VWRLAGRILYCGEAQRTSTYLTDGAKEQIAPELGEDLIDLVRAYLK
jgi:hypothetical protein